MDYDIDIEGVQRAHPFYDKNIKFCPPLHEMNTIDPMHTLVQVTKIENSKK